MSVGTAKADTFGEAFGQTLERQAEDVEVTIRSPSGVPEEMEIAEVGGLHIVIEGRTWEAVMAAKERVQDGLSGMGIAWEDHSTLERRVPSPTESYRVALATEALTEKHIANTPWQLVDDPPGINADLEDETPVSTSQRLSFPLESLTTEQRSIFKQFLSERHEDLLNVCEPLWLALVLSKHRPATEISAFSSSSLTPEQLATAFDLPYQQWTENTITVARTSWRLDLLPPRDDFSDTYHRRLGCFFGYPKEDVEKFLTDSSDRIMPWEHVADGVFSAEEVAYTKFVPQGRPSSIEEYERFIRNGKYNYEIIVDYAERWDFPALSAYADWVHQDTRTKVLVHS
ncbi:hypothetical protein [Halocatena halophila]|uniref:hypothetical protein n=1 Tax=Halocatena halophila TaxID=2814576 RepID=UPI002ED289B9